MREKFEVLSIVDGIEPPVRQRFTPEACAGERAGDSTDRVRVAAAMVGTPSGTVGVFDYWLWRIVRRWKLRLASSMHRPHTEPHYIKQTRCIPNAEDKRQPL